MDIGEYILNGIRSLFVPDTEFITDKVDAIKEKFGFIENIKSAWNSISNIITSENEEIPKIEIDLSKAEGKYNYGGKVLALDLTWYSRFKPTVDLIIIAFSYISFTFLVFKRLPDIISGAGAVTKTKDD